MNNNNPNLDKNMQFADLMIEEAGLYRDLDGTIKSQEDDSELMVNGKTLIYPFDQTNIDFRTDMEFDPLDNPSLSRYMFGYFLQKYVDEDVSGFHTAPDPNVKDKSTVIVETDGNKIIESGSYYSDPVKYVDAMMRLNGMDNPDLSAFDGPIEKRAKRRKK